MCRALGGKVNDCLILGLFVLCLGGERSKLWSFPVRRANEMDGTRSINERGREETRRGSRRHDGMVVIYSALIFRLGSVASSLVCYGLGVFIAALDLGLSF